jgi:hypothetical protein
LHEKKAIAEAHGATLAAHAQPEGGLEIEVSFTMTEVGAARELAAHDRAQSAFTGASDKSQPHPRGRAST